MRGIELPDAVREVGDFSVFVPDKGLLTCVVIGVSVVVWDVVEFSMGWDMILSWFSWLKTMMLCGWVVSIGGSLVGWISSNCSMEWSTLIVIELCAI